MELNEESIKKLQKSIITELVAELKTAIVINQKDLLTREEAALFMGIKAKTLADISGRGEIPYIKSKGKLTYYNKKDLLDYMLAGGKRETTAALRSHALAERMIANQ